MRGHSLRGHHRNRVASRLRVGDRVSARTDLATYCAARRFTPRTAAELYQSRIEEKAIRCRVLGFPWPDDAREVAVQLASATHPLPEWPSQRDLTAVRRAHAATDALIERLYR